DPSLYISVATYARPFKTIKTAKLIGANGMTMALYLLNPFSYRRAVNNNIQLLVYQNYLSLFINWPASVRRLFKWFPKIAVFTDRPDKIVPVVNDLSNIK